MRCNERIRISPIRLVDAENQQVGVMPTDQALRMARDAGMDLVEVAPTERPPVCRIMDFGKYKYQQKKKKQKHREQHLKEVRLRPKTDDHDREIKVKRAMNFLRKGDKVQFKMVFRGRERAHRQIGQEIFAGIIRGFGLLVKVERPPSLDGRDMIMVLAPNKSAFEKLAQSEADKARQAEQAELQPAKARQAEQAKPQPAKTEPAATGQAETAPAATGQAEIAPDNPETATAPENPETATAPENPETVAGPDNPETAASERTESTSAAAPPAADAAEG